MKSVFFLTLLTVHTFVVYTEQRTLNCTKADQRRVDSVFSKLLTVGDSSRKFPLNQTEAQHYCSETRELLKYAENYNKQCLKEMPKQLISIFLYTLKNTVNQMCKPGSKRRKQLLAAAPCINSADNQLNKCLVQMIDLLLGIQFADQKLKIPHVCCQFDKLEECIAESLKKFDICTENHEKFFLQFVNSIFGNAAQVTCGEYISSDKCSQLGAPPQKKKHQQRTKSFINPFIEVFDSFPPIS